MGIVVRCVRRPDLLYSARGSRYWIGHHPLDNDPVRLLRNALGPCPSNDELHNYSRGTLDEEVRSALSSHIDLCGICQVRLERIESFESALSEPDSDAPGWKSAQKRLH